METLADLKEAIEARISIGQLIGTRANRIICPFHGGPSTAFAIKHHKNSWRCFSQCDDGRWHNIFDWTMRVHSCDFYTALKILAEQAGIPMGVNKERVEILCGALSYYHQNLDSYPDVQAYLKKRGFGEDWIFRRHIGYAGDSIPMGVSIGKLESVGLARRDSRGIRPFFRNRIVYPVYDSFINLVQMQGRRFPEDKSIDPLLAPPKYLGMPNEVDLPGRSLYACMACEDLALKGLFLDQQGDYVFLAEGWPDAETLSEWGLKAVGLFGHSGIELHSRILNRFKQVFVVLDPDKASQSTIHEKLYPLMMKIPGVEVKNIYLDTDGLDVNDWAMQGKPQGEKLDPYKDEHKIEQLRQMVDNAPSFIEDLIKHWGGNPLKMLPLLHLVAVQPDRERWVWELAQRWREDEKSIRFSLRVLAQENLDG